MKTRNSIPRTGAAVAARKLAVLLLALSFATAPLLAEVVYVTARPSPSGAGPNFDGTYFDFGVDPFDITLLSLGDTSAIASAPGRPATGGARYYPSSVDLTDTNLGVAVVPTLGTPGGVYQIHHNFSSTAGNVSTNVVMSVSSTNASFSVSETTAFQRSFGNPANQWTFIGYLTNDVGSATPYLRFNYQSGLVNAGLQLRLLVDCWRFTLLEPCLLTPVVGVTGPLSTNSENVVVTGVSETATAITVYQDTGAGMVQIGQKTADITAGNNLVTVSGLVKDGQVAATQTVGGQEGCVPASGTIVGGGANVNLRVALIMRENTALTGPVGAAGSGGILHHLGSFTLLSGSCPEQGLILEPSTEWQTVTFTRGIDGVATWFGTDPTPGTLDGDFGAMDGIAFACEGDNGPFDVYIDDLANGTNGVFQDFEAADAGAVDFAFRAPSFSGTTSGNLMSAPNVAQVTSATASSGTKSLRVRWQFTTPALNRWLRLVTAGATPVQNPQVDLNEPISFKILIPPPGFTPVSPVPSDIAITRDGNNVILNWEGSYQLQSATSVTGPYSDVTGITSGPYTNAIGTGPQFFRLVNQLD